VCGPGWNAHLCTMVMMYVYVMYSHRGEKIVRIVADHIIMAGVVGWLADGH
jgi:hypothetical protein